MTPTDFSTEIQALLSGYSSPNKTEAIAYLEKNIHNVLTEQVNVTFLMKQAKDVIGALINELAGEELKQVDLNESVLKKALHQLLYKFTNDNMIVEKITQRTLDFIAENFKDSQYPYHITDDALRNYLYDELDYEIENPLKPLEKDAFFYDHFSFLEAYTNFIHEYMDKYDAKIRIPLENMYDDVVESAEDLIVEQAVLGRYYEKDLLATLFPEITEIRADLIPVKQAYFEVKLKEAPSGISKIDHDQYAHDAMLFAEDMCLEVEDNYMNHAIEKWLKHKPPILKDILDFNRVKKTARDYAIHNEMVDAIETLKKKEEIMSLNDRVLTPEEIDQFAVGLSNFLNKAQQHKLNFLLSPEMEIRLNPKNKDFFLNAFSFKELFDHLPRELTHAFMTQQQPFTPEMVKGLGLTRWHKPQNLLQGIADFLNNDKVLIDAASFLKWHNDTIVHKVMKSQNKYLQQEREQFQFLLTSSKSEVVDEKKSTALLNLSAKNNKKLFKVIMQHTNLPTLKQALERLPQQEDRYFANLLAQRIAKMSDFRNRSHTGLFKENTAANVLPLEKNAQENAPRLSN